MKFFSNISGGCCKMDTEVHLHSFRNRATGCYYLTFGLHVALQGERKLFFEIFCLLVWCMYMCMVYVCVCLYVFGCVCFVCFVFSRENFCKYVTQKNLNNCFKVIKNTVKIMLLGIAGWLKSERLLTDMYRGGEGKTVCKSCWNQDSNSRAKFLSGHGEESRISDVLICFRFYKAMKALLVDLLLGMA